jgi:2-amino-4-hydroxy-6-hydroxymethyldihydropteridine diphosphokinase
VTREAVVCIGLGSNLGDREEHLRRAVLAIRETVAIARISSLWLTEPVGLREQPLFYNAALRGYSGLEPRALLDALIAIEESSGRRRRKEHVAMGPRTLDLDLLLYDDLEIDEPGLVLPHPRMAERRFVLAPLAEIAADVRIGSDRRTVAQVLAELPEPGGVERLDLARWPPSLR